jgi:replication factor A1
MKFILLYGVCVFRWAIKARVTNKSNIRTYTNAKGEGKLFNVEFIDTTGEIRASGFNEQVDKFYDLLELDRVFYVSRCQLKAANKQYSKLENDYEMTFSNDTVIEPCNEEDSVPHMNLHLVKLCEMPHKNANDFVGKKAQKSAVLLHFIFIFKLKINASVFFRSLGSSMLKLL